MFNKYIIPEEDSSQFMKRVGDSGGGQYSVNMKEAFNQLAWTTLENIVMERFGSKAARIFRYDTKIYFMHRVSCKYKLSIFNFYLQVSEG